MIHLPDALPAQKAQAEPMRTIIGALKIFVFVLSAGLTLLIQSTVFLFTRGKFALIYPRAYHAFCCHLFGVKIITEGMPAAPAPGTVYIGNHISYLDISAVGSIVKGCFVAKKDVESWPLFGILGKMGQTIYVSRTPAHAARETQTLLGRLDDGLPLIVFPEGTSSDGTKILPFKSSFFEIFLNRETIIQPFTISILEIDEKPAVTSEQRDRYTWHGDMTLLPHLWWFAKSKGAILRVKFEEPLISTSFTDRKQLSQACYTQVVKGLDLSLVAA